MRHDRLSLVVSRPCHDALHEAAELRRHMSVLEEEPATWHKARSQTIYCCTDSSESGTQTSMFIYASVPSPEYNSLSVRTDVLLSRSGIICRQRSQCHLENLPGSKEHRRRLKPPSLRGPPVIGAGCHGRNALHFTICGWHQPARRAEPARGQMLTMSFPQIRTRHLDNARAAFRQSVRGKGGQVVGAGRWPAGSRRIDGPI
ncbi:hypothetical protein MHUMG1_05644 [Metarhizium humberi]|uniref:Uncharacterized protein n=1 Tax=Metarhizium humberi TaxID=2596975 RepID=A0A9P8MAF2_9HYPO|nr:hypothetical protein MHUMG1_05644 [Metarhizium humberi]